MLNYSMGIKQEKIYAPKVKLKDLPATTCFRDQYNNLLMRLADDVSVEIKEKNNNILCVCFSFSPDIGKGGLIWYPPEYEVVPFESFLTVRE